jgi:membrane protease YdiL (CAAX protease family)
MSNETLSEIADPLPRRRGWIARFFAFPLVWLVIGAATITIGDGVLVGIGSEGGTIGTIIGALAGAALSLALYVVTMRFIARRRMPELFHKGALRQLSIGGVIGGAFILVSYALAVAFGGFTVEWHPVNAVTTIATVISVNLGAAIVEELLFRGIVLQAFERLLGSGAALALSAALFGLLHLLNPGATLWSSLAIAIEAGLLLGAAFLWRRSLWLVIGLHFTWNTLEGLLGIPVSGHRDPGLLSSTPSGADLLSGGNFGIEASIIPVVIGILLTITLLVARNRSRRRDTEISTIAAAGR